MSKYAIIDNNGKVKKVMVTNEELANPPTNWVQVDTADETIIGTTINSEITRSALNTASDYTPWVSTNEVFRDEDMNHSLETDLDAIEAALEDKAESDHTHTGYAEAIHTHTGYAEINHTHTGYAEVDHIHTGYAAENHGHSYNDLADKPTIPEAYTHPATHPASMITGLPTALPANGGNADTVGGKHASEFAATAHTHAQNEVTGLSAALDGKANATHTHTVFSASSVASYKLIYISTDGNDENDGFSQTNAMATIKGVIKKYADSYKALDIRLLDGTYSETTYAISCDQCNLSIRSASENKDACILNISGTIETNVNKLRLYNITINCTEIGVRPISVTAGSLYAYNVRINVPTDSESSCVNVYNGSVAFLMNCVLNAGIGTSAGAAVYGNQALLIKAINCTSERTINLGCQASNGTDIWYTNTLTATTAARETYYGKCTVR